MEPKKNPKYDVHKNSRMVFFFSLCISILLVLSAFQWKSSLTNPVIEPTPTGLIYDPLYEVPITEIKNTPPEAKPIKEKITYTNPVEATTDVLVEPDENIKIDVPVEPIVIPNAFAEPEAVPDTFLVVEKMPLPKGGYARFYEFLSKETKFPKAAIRNEAGGKVFVEFIVNKNGEPANLRVIKGIGFGCDEEALRVIALTKWEAGKQRGVPVNVRMTLPIQFEIR